MNTSRIRFIWAIEIIKFVLTLFILWLPATKDVLAQDFWEDTNLSSFSAVYDFAFNSSRHIFVATAGDGVFRSINNGGSWTSINIGLTSTLVFYLAINSHGHIFAATGGGLFRSTNNGQYWTSVNDNGASDIAINSTDHIFIANSIGFFRSIDNGENWIFINDDLIELSVNTLAINSNGYIFAGTDSGIFVSVDNGESWVPSNNGLTETFIFILAINSKGHIFTGTGYGVFRSTNNGNNWEPINNGLTSLYLIRALAINSRNELFTVNGGGVSRSTNNGDNWTPVNSGLYPNVFSLAINSIGFAFAGTGSGDIFRTVEPTIPTYNLSTIISFPSLSNASDYKATDYRIVGLPGVSNQPVTDFLSGNQNKDWQVFWDNGATTNFLVGFDGSPTFRFTLGRAFWIINKGPLNINTIVPTPPLNPTQDVGIPLHFGWNLITNPLTTSIAWSMIKSANNLVEPIWTFNGSFSQASNFDPYVGYYFFNATNLDTLKIPYSLYSSVSIVPIGEISKNANWQVKISFSSDVFIDEATWFGIYNEANFGLDRFDFRKPRLIATTPTVFFCRPNWDADYSSFATDIRPEIKELESWDFQVRMNQRKTSQLSFYGIRQIPTQFEVYLIDEGRTKKINLREDSLYHFTHVGEISNFCVVVGKKEAVQEKLNSVALPIVFTLGPNYPNPFNSSTTIPVSMPFALEIKLKIYNILGEEVRTIYNGSLEAGQYWFSWDGRDEAGNDSASGVYFYHLIINKGVSLFHKMILIR